MHDANAGCRPLLLSLTFAAGVALQSAPCLAGSIGLLVPAYFYPGSGGPGGVGDGWAAMDAAAAQVPLTAIFNPDSGPLPGPADPNYAAAMTNLEAAGGKVVAYLYTDDGNTPLATVEGQISTYLIQYGTLLKGFFLDGMLVTPATMSYYQVLDAYIKNLSASYTVIGNPGQPSLNGVSPANYLSTADLFNIFEGPNTGGSGFNNYPNGQNWFQSYPSGRFSNIIYDTPASAMPGDIATAVQLDAGALYITDQLQSNPYDQLPSYWDQEVADIAGYSTPVPEPGALPLVLLGGLATVGAAAATRGRRA